MLQGSEEIRDHRIDPNGDEHLLEPDKKNHYSLEFLQGQVGGFIEVIPCPFSRKHIGIVNEEGLILGLEYNEKASEMFDGALVGPVVIISKGRMR